MALVLPPKGRDRVAPLGVLLTDGPNGPPVVDGLTVWAWPEGKDDRRVAGVLNAAGVAWFGRLPGVTVSPLDPFAGVGKSFVVEVRDGLGRFLPGRVVVTAPAKGAVAVALRSAPVRTVPPARLAFRAELWDAANDRPAAFALLTVRVARNGNGGAPPETLEQIAKRVLAVGLADRDGRVLVVGDRPTPKPPAVAGPPPKWDDPRKLEVEVRYDPAPPPELPRLDRLSVLPVARVWNRRSPDEPFAPPDLLSAAPPPFRCDGVGRLLVTSP